MHQWFSPVLKVSGRGSTLLGSLLKSRRQNLGTVYVCLPAIALTLTSEKNPCTLFVYYWWGGILGENSLPLTTSAALLGNVGSAWGIPLSLPCWGKSEGFVWSLHGCSLRSEHTAMLRCTQPLFVYCGDRLDSKASFKTHVGSEGLWTHLTSLCVHGYGTSGCYTVHVHHPKSVAALCWAKTESKQPDKCTNLMLWTTRWSHSIYFSHTLKLLPLSSQTDAYLHSRWEEIQLEMCWAK